MLLSLFSGVGDRISIAIEIASQIKYLPVTLFVIPTFVGTLYL